LDGIFCHSAPILAYLFFYSYEAEFVQDLCKGEKKLGQSFNYTFRYIDDVSSLNNKNYTNFLHRIYSVELGVKDTTDSSNSASYLDFYLEHYINGTLTTKLYDNVTILTFLSSTIRFSIVTSRHLLHMVFTCRS